MIKVQNNTPTREPLPSFLLGLAPESLADLSWTDASLSVQDCAWWPEDNQTQALGENQKYGDEVLTVDAGRNVVIVTRQVVPMTTEEIAARDAEIAAQKQQYRDQLNAEIAVLQARLAALDEVSQ